ncbi:hypothetical protein JOF41_006358 [Saccharothrix coeruleofusca]|uniref:hypothetical protein n=1 Tax=Saccharothrix coeruleofusca TaxID=33919 RepID=UPI001AEA1168|nr:hypothetical protein [Saccharothrix coeruleofusca]MBP2340180.1 hypothetical protein [Saccharothrix coeruleofusca]
MHKSIEGALAEHTEREAKRRRFLERAAAVVTTAPSSVDDTLLSLSLPYPKRKGDSAFLHRVDQVLRDAAR